MPLDARKEVIGGVIAKLQIGNDKIMTELLRTVELERDYKAAVWAYNELALQARDELNKLRLEFEALDFNRED